MAMSAGGRGDLNSEINVTPMVDVMLVLLVIFMVTAPLLNTGVEVNLPKTDTAPIKDPKGDPTLTLSCAAEPAAAAAGAAAATTAAAQPKCSVVKLFLDGQPVTWSDLGNQLRNSPRVKKAGKLQIAADQDLSYNVVITAMAVAQNANVGSLQLVSDPGAQLDLEALDHGQKQPAEKPITPDTPPPSPAR